MAAKASKTKKSEAETAADPKAKAPAKTAKKKTAKKTTRKSAKANKEVRLKAFWGVFNQSLTAVETFEYSQRQQARKRAKELSESRKSPHFVQLIKKVIEE
jgi:hypothetical protein